MPKKLFSFEFISLNFVSFFAFCNMAVFYGFYSYLGRIGIAVEWRGFLVGLEPMTAFALRLVLVPLIHAGNAVWVMLTSLVMLLVALNSYTWATTLAGLAVLRIFHGAAFVLLVSAGMALVVQFIPKEKSAQGFGVVSLAALIPYSLVPVLAEVLLRDGFGESRVYAMVSLMALPGMVLLVAIKRRLETALQSLDRALLQRPSVGEIQENLRERDVLLLLGANVLIYISHASVFYFMKNLFQSLEHGDVGMFFTISSVVMIVVRLVGGKVLNRLNKVYTINGFLLFLAGAAPATEPAGGGLLGVCSCRLIWIMSWCHLALAQCHLVPDFSGRASWCQRQSVAFHDGYWLLPKPLSGGCASGTRLARGGHFSDLHPVFALGGSVHWDVASRISLMLRRHG